MKLSFLCVIFAVAFSLPIVGLGAETSVDVSKINQGYRPVSCTKAGAHTFAFVEKREISGNDVVTKIEVFQKESDESFKLLCTTPGACWGASRGESSICLRYRQSDGRTGGFAWIEHKLIRKSSRDGNPCSHPAS